MSVPPEEITSEKVVQTFLSGRFPAILRHAVNGSSARETARVISVVRGDSRNATRRPRLRSRHPAARARQSPRGSDQGWFV